MKPSDILTLQIFFHLVGDYITQSHWMATRKGEDWRAALTHATVYTLPFYFIADGNARAIIVSTHFLIDRYRLARFVVYAKNVLLDPRFYRSVWLAGASSWHDLPPEDIQKFENDFHWSNCNITGYPSDAPPWLAFWLLIIADNILHLTINYLAIRFL